MKHLAARDMYQEKGSLWKMKACLTHFQNRAMQVNHMISRVKIMEGLPIFLGWGYFERPVHIFLFVKQKFLAYHVSGILRVHSSLKYGVGLSILTQFLAKREDIFPPDFSFQNHGR